MKTKYIKRRGHAYAVVRSPKSVAHLNPQSLTHSVHKEFARQLKDRTDGRILVDISPKEKLKFPSLENGVMLDAHGRGISGMQFEGILNQCRWERGHYLANETSRSGKPYARKRQVDPVRQMSISAFPAHALAFSAMELAGAPCASIVAAAAFALGEAFQWQTPYELLAMAIHPEESTLHFHLHYSVVNAGNRLLHEGSQLGQPARNLLGVGRIGTLRLVEFKFWPEADALDIRQTLKTKTDKFGAVPIDWLLAETLDGTWEQFFKLSKDPKVYTAYEIAMQLYRKRVR